MMEVSEMIKHYLQMEQWNRLTIRTQRVALAPVVQAAAVPVAVLTAGHLPVPHVSDFLENIVNRPAVLGMISN